MITFCSSLSHLELPVQGLHVGRRLQYHPMVMKEPGVRFYAAAPIVTSSGVRIGCM